MKGDKDKTVDLIGFSFVGSWAVISVLSHIMG